MSDNRDTRSSSALFKRAEQLKRWEESDTNKQSPIPKQASRIQFSLGIVFLAACTAGDKDEVQKLLNMGADINTANVDGLTALHQACIDDNLDMVEFLVSRGADVNRGDNEGWTPLHATTSCGFLSIARYLLENGADVGAVNCDGELAVDIAESDNMAQLLQKAIDEKGIDCDSSRNAEVNTLLNDAKYWTKNGYVEVRDQKTGGTPLHVAAAKGYVDVARILLEECHADPDCVDYEGWTPLHAAALWGHKEAAAILLKNGADPDIKNYSGQTCMDLVDPAISTWLAEAALKAPKRIKNNNNNNNNNIIRVRSAPPDAKSIVQDSINDKPVFTEKANKQPEGKPPKGRAPSPEAPTENSTGEEPPSWRRPASMRSRQQTEITRDNNKVPLSNNHTDNDPILRRTHSFENDKTFYQRYRDVTARIKASSCPSIPPLPQATPAAATVELRKRTHEATNNTTDTNNDDAHNRTSPTPERRDDTKTWSSQINQNTNNTQTIRSSVESLELTPNNNNVTPPAATPTKLSPGNIFKNFFKSFVPPVKDEESETQRKAHAKRVRETRRSTQGVTLDEIKSAEQLVKKKNTNGSPEKEALPPVAVPTINKKIDEIASVTSPEKSQPKSGVGEDTVTMALACASATATATIAANAGERRPSWRLRLDPTNKFELEEAGRSPPRSPASVVAVTTSSAVPSTSTDATVTIPLRRPFTNSKSSPSLITVSDDKAVCDDEKEQESSAESKSSSSSPASTQAALNMIQRRRRPKRRSTGVGHVDMDDITNDRGTGDAEAENDIKQSGSERTVDDSSADLDYKVLYEEASSEVQRLRSLLATSEQQLRDARSTITRLTQVNQNSISEIEKREKRAMERKLSEMEEELKIQHALQTENMRLRDENGALIRVISKLSK